GCEENIRPSLGNHKLHIKNNTNISLIADKVRLEQVLNNILSNAIKYSPDANKVDLEVTQEGNNLVVSIRDYGIGIPNDKIDNLIDRYYRIDNDHVRFPGLGIGLHIATEILKHHQGKI